MDYVITRLVCAFLCAVIISQTGSLTQLASRNMLASPSTLGLDGLSVVWLLFFYSLSLVFHFELSSLSVFFIGLPVFVLIGFLFSKFVPASQKMDKLIFLGLTFNLLVGAIFSLCQFLFQALNLPFPSELWFGHFRFPMMEFIPFLLTFEAFILFGIYRFRMELIMHSLGGSFSNSNFQRKNFFFLFIFLSISVGTFLVVSFFGAFSFIGLIFPLIARKLFLRKFDLMGEIILGSFLNGMIFTLIDFICYEFPILGAEIPMGLLSTSIGAVGLILLIWYSNKREKLAKLNK